MQRKLLKTHQILLICLILAQIANFSFAQTSDSCFINVPNCQFCSNDQTCQFCIAGFKLLQNQCSQCTGCDAGIGCFGPPTNTECCMDNCASCQDGTTCSNCSPKFYYDQTAPSCKPCDASCANSCYGPAANQCCKKNCINCLNQAQCLTCGAGFYRVGDNCQPECKDNSTDCLKCDTTTSCQTCQSGYTRQEVSQTTSVCVACGGSCTQCTYDSKTVIITCTACASQSYLDQAQCKACTNTCANKYCYSFSECCEANCSLCTSKTQCQKCTENYNLFKNDCIQQCTNASNFCVTCTDQKNCNTCYPGYYLESDTQNQITKCTICPIDSTECKFGCFGPGFTDCCSDNCSSCKDGQTCFGCATGFNLYLNRCVAACASYQPNQNCLQCQSSKECGTCKDGFYKDTQNGVTVCLKCPVACASCSDVNTCLSCNLGYFYDNVNKSCLACDNSCTSSKCYGTQAGECCDNSCQTCSGKLNNQCLTCPPGNYLFKGTCVPTCVVNENGCNLCTSDQVCSKCNYEFYKDTDVTTQVTVCLACGVGCAVCTSATECSYCDPTYFLKTDKTCEKCSDSCASNYCYQEYVDASSCCSTDCDVCKDNNTCNHCTNDKYLFEGSCISSCKNQSDDPTSKCLQCNTTSPNDCDTCDIGYFKQPSAGTTACKTCMNTCYECTTGTTCSSCKFNYYLDSTDQQCKACGTSCPNKYCWGNGLTDCCLANCSICKNGTTCQVCVQGFSSFTVGTTQTCEPPCKNLDYWCETCDQDPTKGCSKCAVGGYSVTSTDGKQTVCRQCPTGCSTCNSATECLTCSSTYYLDSTSKLCTKCVTPGCNNLYCFGVNATDCCGANCSVCTSGDKCQFCVAGFNLNNQSCFPDCESKQNNCMTCQNKQICKVCYDGYYLLADATTNVTVCGQCPEGCALCSDVNTCTSCKSTFFLDGTLCSDCSKTSSACLGNYCFGKDAGNCCSAECQNCTSDQNCLACGSGFSLFEKKCVANCKTGDNNCETCLDDDTCQTCKDGFYPNTSGTTTICSACSNNCEICQGAQGEVCSQCASTYYVSSNTCTKCSKCSGNYCFGPLDNDCCSSNCIQCQDSKTCLACDTNYLSYQSGCISPCENNVASCLECSQDGKTCNKCKDGYFSLLDTKTQVSQCQSCDSSCRTCSEFKKCTSCNVTFYLDTTSNTCIQCPSGTDYCSNQYCFGPGKTDCCQENCDICLSTECLICKQPFTVDSTDKTKCTTGCQAGQNNCTECEQGTSNCKTCDKGFYIITSGGVNICQNCKDPKCDRCDTNGDCLICQSTFYLNASDKSCKVCSTCTNNFCFGPTDQDCCLTNCKQCKDKLTCETCDDNYDYGTKKDKTNFCAPYCTTGDTTHCQTCDTATNKANCQQCQDGWFVNTNDLPQLCVACPQNCTKCISLDECTECKQPFQLNNKQCTQGCVEKTNNCQTCNGTDCKTCDDGYYLVKDTQSNIISCSKCMDNCKSCCSNISCITCNDGYETSNDYICVKKVTPPTCKGGENNCKTCDQDNKNCTVCDTGFFVSAGLCLKCSDSSLNCTECQLDGTSLKCTKCSDDTKFQLFNDRCLAKCQDQTDQCQTCCQTNYCQTDKTCTECQEHFYLDTDQKKCEVCPETTPNCYYDSTAANKTAACMANCAICLSAVNCESCFPSYYYKPTAQNPKIKKIQGLFDQFIVADAAAQGQCVSCSEIPGCINCGLDIFQQLQCNQCSDNSYALVNGKCILCNISTGITNCKICDNDQHCLQCLDTYFLSEDKKTCNACSTNCNICHTGTCCDKCNINYIEEFNNQERVCKTTQPSESSSSSSKSTQLIITLISICALIITIFI